MISFLLSTLISVGAHAKIVWQPVEYKQGDTVMQGYIAYDDKSAAKRPGIVLVHDWMGMSPFVKGRSMELAAMGYTVFAADIYGKGVRPKDTKEAADTSGIYKKDRALLRARVRAAYDQLKAHETVDSEKLAVTGFCFGGMTALELGRSGAPLKSIVSFHGNLDSPAPNDGKNIKARVLVLHGADDPWVPPTQVADFEKEMKAAKVDYKIVSYPGAVHAFTNPMAGNDNSKGAAYNADADKKSKVAMTEFFAETLKK